MHPHIKITLRDDRGNVVSIEADDRENTYLEGAVKTLKPLVLELLAALRAKNEAPSTKN